MYMQVQTDMIYRVSPLDLSSLTYKVRIFIHTNLMPNISRDQELDLINSVDFFSLTKLIFFGKTYYYHGTTKIKQKKCSAQHTSFAATINT